MTQYNCTALGHRPKHEGLIQPWCVHFHNAHSSKQKYTSSHKKVQPFCNIDSTKIILPPCQKSGSDACTIRTIKWIRHQYVYTSFELSPNLICYSLLAYIHDTRGLPPMVAIMMITIILYSANPPWLPNRYLSLTDANEVSLSLSSYQINRSAGCVPTILVPDSLPTCERG